MIGNSDSSVRKKYGTEYRSIEERKVNIVLSFCATNSEIRGKRSNEYGCRG